MDASPAYRPRATLLIRACCADLPASGREMQVYMSQAEASVTGVSQRQEQINGGATGFAGLRPACLIEPGRVSGLSIMGTQVEVLLRGQDTADRLAICRIHAQPGDGVPLHRHIREDETFIVIDGRLRVIVGERETVVGPGAVAMLPQDVPHGWWVAGEEPASFYVLGTPAGLDRFFPELAIMTAGLPQPWDQVIATSLRFGIVFDDASGLPGVLP